MNHCIIIGNLTADPVLRQAQTANGMISVANFTIAVNDPHNRDKEATFFNCTAWRAPGEVIHRYMRKGMKMMVSGQIGIRRYTTRNGEAGANLELQVEQFEFLSKVENAQAQAKAAPAPAQNKPDSGYTVVESDELPF